MTRRFADRRWLHADQLGSVIAVSNGAGAALAINSYDEYGQPAAANVGRFQYTGQIWLAEIALYHYKARAYSPTLGRFLQTDPILHAGGMNLYAYVGNDPVNGSDPSGLFGNPEDIVVPGFAEFSLLPFINGSIGGNISFSFPNINLPTITDGESETIDVNCDAACRGDFIIDEPGLDQEHELLVLGGATGRVLLSGLRFLGLLGPSKDVLFNARQRVGTALTKRDLYHNIMNNRVLQGMIARYGRSFSIRDARGRPESLYQATGTFRGERGRFEYIVNGRGQITHQRFIPGARISGRPN